jgi:hypothetical protein
MEDEMAKTKTQAKDQKLAPEGNRYVRAARVLAKDDTIDVKTLADRAFMSETTAARCKEAWDAVIAALIEVGRLPDPAKAAAKKSAPRCATRRSRSNAVHRHGGRGGILIRLSSKEECPRSKDRRLFCGSCAPGNVRALCDVWKIQKPGSKPMGALDAFGQPHFLKRATPPGGNCNPEIRTNP